MRWRARAKWWYPWDTPEETHVSILDDAASERRKVVVQRPSFVRSRSCGNLGGVTETPPRASPESPTNTKGDLGGRIRGGGGELASAKNPGIVAISVLQDGALRALNRLLSMSRVSSAARHFAFVFRDRNRAGIKGAARLLDGFKRVNNSGTDHSAKCPM